MEPRGTYLNGVLYGFFPASLILIRNWKELNKLGTPALPDHRINVYLKSLNLVKSLHNHYAEPQRARSRWLGLEVFKDSYNCQRAALTIEEFQDRLGRMKVANSEVTNCVTGPGVNSGKLGMLTWRLHIHRQQQCGSQAPGRFGAVGSQLGNNPSGAAMLPVEPTEKEFTTKYTANLPNKNIPSIRYLNTGLHQPRKPILVLLSVAGNQEEGLLLIYDSTTTSSV